MAVEREGESQELLDPSPGLKELRQETPSTAFLLHRVDVVAAERKAHAVSEHVPALDGLRGIAILLVILHHGLIGWGASRSAVEQVFQAVLGHCWVGVDLFFVLSGFLITGILIDTRGKKNYFGSFYPRRMLRTFPLYYATILVCLVLLPALPLSGMQGLRDLSAHQGWFWLHVSNFYDLSHTLLKMDGPGAGWMSTFWSLAVEEHFYLVWPLLVFRCSPRQVVLLSLGLLGGVLLLRIVLAAQGWDFQSLYRNTATRLDGLLFGALVAGLSRGPAGLGPHVRAFKILVGCSVAGLVLLRVFGGRLDGLYAFCSKTIVFSAVAAIFAAALVLVLRSAARSRVHVLLTGRFLQACGRHSYAMYILNIPLLMVIGMLVTPSEVPLLGRTPGTLGCVVLGILASLGCALVTWHLLEKHCLKLKRHFVAG